MPNQETILVLEAYLNERVGRYQCAIGYLCAVKSDFEQGVGPVGVHHKGNLDGIVREILLRLGLRVKKYIQCIVASHAEGSDGYRYLNAVADEQAFEPKRRNSLPGGLLVKQRMPYQQGVAKRPRRYIFEGKAEVKGLTFVFGRNGVGTAVRRGQVQYALGHAGIGYQPALQLRCYATQGVAQAQA